MLAALFAVCLVRPACAEEPSREGESGQNAAGSEPVGRPTALGMLGRIEWSPRYRRVSTLDYILTGVGATAAIVTRVIGPPDYGPRGGVWIDEDVRGALRPSSFRQRLLAEDVSDVLLGVTSSYGLFGDPLVNATWLRDSPDVGWQLFWINGEVMALTLGIQQATSNAIGRERPYRRTCGTPELDERTHHCEGADRYRSYFSGHTSVPFSIAAATCVHHAYLPLSGGHAWVPCTVGFAAAAASGTLRIVSDNHYATDVMTGMVVGTAIGLTVPLLHYATGVPTPRARWGRTEVVALPWVYSQGRAAMAGFSISGVLP